MRSKILQALLILIVLPFIAWVIFEKSEATPAQYKEVMMMEEPKHPIVEAAIAVALDDRRMTQAEYAGIKKIAYKYGPGAIDDSH
jgi:hypothetical protein